MVAHSPFIAFVNSVSTVPSAYTFLQRILSSFTTVAYSLICTSLRLWHNISFSRAFWNSSLVSSGFVSLWFVRKSVFDWLICHTTQYAGPVLSTFVLPFLVTDACCGGPYIPSAASRYFAGQWAAQKLIYTNLSLHLDVCSVDDFKSNIFRRARSPAVVVKYEPPKYILNVRATHSTTKYIFCVVS